MPSVAKDLRDTSKLSIDLSAFFRWTGNSSLFTFSFHLYFRPQRSLIFFSLFYFISIVPSRISTLPSA